MILRKTITASLLLSILALPTLLFFALQLQQIATRHEMEEKLERLHLVTIHLPFNSFKWHKKNKEIIVDGKLFDVKSYVVRKNTVEFKGLFDEKETLIKSRIANLADQEQENRGNALMKYTVQLQFLPPRNYLPLLSPVCIDPTPEYPFTQTILSVYLPILSPPPKA